MHWPRRLLWLIALVPLAVMLLFATHADFTSVGTVLNLLGRLAGIGGLAFLLVAAILSSRVPGFDRYFGGLTKLWRTHHLLGGVSFVLILAHPLLLAFAASEVSIEAAARTLVAPEADLSLWLGWAGLLLVMLVLAPSFKFFGEPDYQRWRNLHRLSALGVAAALAHTFLAARSVPEPVNALIWMVFALAAVTALSYRFVFSRRIGSLSYRIAEVDRPANNIVELTLEPLGKSLSYNPGQFVYLTPLDKELVAGRGQEHPYTLSSSPDEARLRVAIKAMGDATRAIQHVRSGSEVRIEGPYGDLFRRSDPARGELWIAGGIGIAPFLSRARHLALQAERRADSTDVHLVYCVQDEARAHFSDELRSLASGIPGFEIAIHYFYREGPLSQVYLTGQCPDFANREAYICGPDPLIRLAIRILLAAGMAPNRIHSEEFTLL